MHSGFWICCYEMDDCNKNWSWEEVAKSNVTVTPEELKVGSY